jgi:lactoylglutathione lyase
MRHDTSRDTERWTQFVFDFVSEKTVVGTYVDSPQGTGEAALTFVVPHIDGAKAYLEYRGVEVSDVYDVGAGVLLAYFKDYDGNQLALRENVPL